MAKIESIPYGEIVDRVKRKVGCSKGRIADQAATLRWAWWPSEPGYVSQLMSGYGKESDFPVLESEFREEVQAIRETLEELGHTPELADWQKGSSDAARDLFQSLNQSATAHSVWDEIGVPVRRRGDTVFRIWSPSDVMGSPIIRAMSVDAYVAAVAEHTAADRVEIAGLKKRLGDWRNATIVLGIVISLVILNVLLT